MKIGILGGSFNPAHDGHLHISLLAIKKLNLDQLWWIPTKYNPFKDQANYLSHQQRLKDCQNFVKNHPKIHVKNFVEIYTIKLIQHLQKSHKNHEFFWIMGADNFENFHRWKNFNKLIKLLPIVIFSRDDYLAKIRKTKAWQIYQTKRNLNSSQFLTNSNFQKLSNFNHRNNAFNNRKPIDNTKSLPNFIIFKSKNLVISSRQIRSKTTN